MESEFSMTSVTGKKIIIGGIRIYSISAMTLKTAATISSGGWYHVAFYLYGPVWNGRRSDAGFYDGQVIATSYVADANDTDRPAKLILMGASDYSCLYVMLQKSNASINSGKSFSYSGLNIKFVTHYPI